MGHPSTLVIRKLGRRYTIPPIAETPRESILTRTTAPSAVQRWFINRIIWNTVFKAQYPREHASRDWNWIPLQRMVRRLRRRLVLLPEMLVSIMAPRWVRHTSSRARYSNRIAICTIGRWRGHMWGANEAEWGAMERIFSRIYRRILYIRDSHSWLQSWNITHANVVILITVRVCVHVKNRTTSTSTSTTITQTTPRFVGTISIYGRIESGWTKSQRHFREIWSISDL